MKKKLIFITEALWIGGIESALCNLLNRLDSEQYELSCLILRDCQELAGQLPPHCRLLVADRQHVVSFSKPYRFRRLFNLMEQPQNASRLRRLIWRVCVLLLRAPEARLYAAYLKRQLQNEHFDTAVIYSDRAAEAAVRAVNADRFLMFYHHGAMRREYHDTLGYRRAENVIAVSPGLAQKLQSYRPRYAQKIIAVNNLINIDAVREKSLAQPEVLFPQGQFHIVSCGRLSEAKGMDLAIEACALLVQRGMTDVHWWLVGGGPEEAALRTLIARLGLEAHVTLLGMQENPYPYFRQADVYVQPSRFEGHCVTVLEARLLNVPILATCNAAYEQLHHEKDGLLCQPDAQSIADGVARLYEDAALRQQLRQALRQHDFEADNAAILQRLTDLF